MQEADLGGVLPGTWLPGERAEVVLDAKTGALASPRAHADSLIVTNHRAVKVGVSQGSRTTTLLPLTNVSSVEVFDVARSSERLIQGVGLLLVGVMIGGATWLALNFPLLSVVAGGVPILISVYVLAGWAFPDDEGELRLYASGHVMTQRLGTAAARRDAYGAAYRIYETDGGIGRASCAGAAYARVVYPRRAIRRYAGGRTGQLPEYDGGHCASAGSASVGDGAPEAGAARRASAEGVWPRSVAVGRRPTGVDGVGSGARQRQMRTQGGL